MWLYKNWQVKCAVLGLGAALATEWCYGLYWLYVEKRRRQKLLQHTKLEDREKQFYTILFFPDNKLLCKNSLSQDRCTVPKCIYKHDHTSLDQLISFLSMAKKNLELCIFLFTSEDLSRVILEMHLKGVKVRIITDRSQSYEKCSQITILQAKGISVRFNSSSFLMHHKFVVIDKEKLLNGSFNWTMTATLGNHENIVFTNAKELVQPYVEEFDRLWDQFNPEREEKKKNVAE